MRSYDAAAEDKQREYPEMIVNFNRVATYGASVVRFIERLNNVMELGWRLDD